MKRDHVAEFEQAFLGRRCSMERDPPFWRANFGDQFTMVFMVPWRLVANGRITSGDEDDGQLFGLPAPLDGEERAASVLGERVVQAVHLDQETGDLRIIFDGNGRIDVFNHSCGYEGWHAYYTAAGKRWGLIAMGGGEIAVLPR